MLKNRPHKPVLIVGAGPTGLTLALWLRKLGVPHDLIESRARPSSSSKALSISPASIAQFAVLGSGMGLGAKALPVRKLNLSWRDSLRLASIDLRRLNKVKPWAFMIQRQSCTERDLTDALLVGGGSVERGVRLTDVQQDGETVTATLYGDDGESFIRHYDYVVGCDGKRSVVREAMGATFKEERFGAHLLLGDVRLSWDGADDEVHYRVFDDTFFVLVPLGDGVWRVVIKGEGDTVPAELTPDMLLKPLRTCLPQIRIEGAPTWISSSPLYCAVASHLRKGRLFIAGDAAHLFPPLGGTGMNTGMQDAINLAWKLARAVRGQANVAWVQPLLDSYEQERLPAIEANGAATSHVTKIIVRQARREQDIAPFLPTMANRKVMRQTLPWLHAGFATRYHAAVPAQPGKPCAGALPARLLAALGEGVAYETSQEPTFLVVTLDRSDARSESLGPFGPGLRVLRLIEGPCESTVKERGHGDEYVKALSQQDWYELNDQDGYTYVLRPDGIVSLCLQQASHADIVDHLATLPI